MNFDYVGILSEFQFCKCLDFVFLDSDVARILILSVIKIANMSEFYECQDFDLSGISIVLDIL